MTSRQFRRLAGNRLARKQMGRAAWRAVALRRMNKQEQA